jgi:hypothetical protein
MLKLEFTFDFLNDLMYKLQTISKIFRNHRNLVKRCFIKFLWYPYAIAKFKLVALRFIKKKSFIHKKSLMDEVNFMNEWRSSQITARPIARISPWDLRYNMTVIIDTWQIVVLLTPSMKRTTSKFIYNWSFSFKTRTWFCNSFRPFILTSMNVLDRLTSLTVF